VTRLHETAGGKRGNYETLFGIGEKKRKGRKKGKTKVVRPLSFWRKKRGKKKMKGNERGND